MRKILFGALLGAIAMYFLDPQHGQGRRQKLASVRGERNVTELEDVRPGATSFSGTSSEVSNIVGDRVAEIRPKGKGTATNGSPVSEPAVEN